MQQRNWLLRYPVKWLGGWFQLFLLVLVIAAVAGGIVWERQRGVPTPPRAQNVVSDISAGSVRKTSFRLAGSATDVRAYYRQELPKRGWQYCGTQTTVHCSNMMPLAGGADQQTDVYRKADDTNYRGSTIEVWPIQNGDGQMFVTVFETKPK
ncbi:MAG: hypothetical protein NVS4B8_16280 [Herpetosiphon sp.]